MYTAAPAARYGHNSQTLASNEDALINVARSFEVTPYAHRCQSTRFARFLCDTMTALGFPVEPDVKIKYARLSGRTFTFLTISDPLSIKGCFRSRQIVVTF